MTNMTNNNKIMTNQFSLCLQHNNITQSELTLL